MCTPTFENLKFTCDTYTPPVITILVGVPGSGKSTFAKRMLEVFKDAVVLSSDSIRERIYGDANCQDNPAKVFSIMQEEAIMALNKGLDVVYDATSITRKSRASILDRVPKHVTKNCVIVWAPVDVCIERDAKRDRTVGPDVIHKMLRRFEAPFYDEGFDNIDVYISDAGHDYQAYYERLISSLDIPHDNPHHSADIKEHCRLCGVGLVDKPVPDVVVNAGFLHDIGKPVTKTFKNNKGEVTPVAHYYGHQSAGAWLSYGIIGNDPTLAWLISTHMSPFINLKYYNNLPFPYRTWIDYLHTADLEAH